MNLKPYERKLLKSDGTVVDYPPARGRKYSFEELQKAVGGYIEIIHPAGSRNYLMVINEEGRLRGLPTNKLATQLYGSNIDHIVGDALVCRDGDID